MHPLSRRTFLSKSCRKASCLLMAALTGTILDGCGVGSNMETIITSAEDGWIELSIANDAPLSTEGSAVAVRYGNAVMVVAHISPGVFTALSGICTHEACEINRYNARTQKFLCPCHGASFDKGGNPVWGPPRQALTSYVTRIEGDTLIIRVV